MKKIYIIVTIIMTVMSSCTSVDSPQTEEEASLSSYSSVQTSHRHDSLKKEYPRIKKYFENVVGGTPLVVPLIGSSDVIMPVSVNNDDTIDEVFLVQHTKKLYSYHVYKIRAVLRIFTDHDMTYNVLVSNCFMAKVVEISGFNYQEIKKINNNEWNGHTVRRPIPIIDFRRDESSENDTHASPNQARSSDATS